MVADSIEISCFLSLFCRDGYVLNFTDKGFNDFTNETIGIPIKQYYQLENPDISKGKALTKFCKEEKIEQIQTLLCSLLKYYEIYCLSEDQQSANWNKYKSYYEKCKEFVSNWNISLNPLNESIKEIEEEFSSAYMTKQFEIMKNMQDSNPTEAIGKAKEILESCCKTILKQRDITINLRGNFKELTNTTLKELKLLPDNINEGNNEIITILNCLKSIVLNLSKLRNFYGSGHGKDADYVGLELRHAHLAVGCCVTLVKFMWETHTSTIKNDNIKVLDNF